MLAVLTSSQMRKGQPAVVDPARPTRSEMRRWQEGHRRAAERQRQLDASGRVDEKQVAARVTDLFDAALAPGNRIEFGDPIRRRDEAAVRAIWRKLRAGHVKIR